MSVFQRTKWFAQMLQKQKRSSQQRTRKRVKVRRNVFLWLLQMGLWPCGDSNPTSVPATAKTAAVVPAARAVPAELCVVPRCLVGRLEVPRKPARRPLTCASLIHPEVQPLGPRGSLYPHGNPRIGYDCPLLLLRGIGESGRFMNSPKGPGLSVRSVLLTRSLLSRITRSV